MFFHVPSFEIFIIKVYSFINILGNLYDINRIYEFV
jgi:hypothetical protein